MAEPVKIRIQTDGAKETKRDIDAVVEATDAVTEAGARQARVVEGALTTARAQNAAMGEAAKKRREEAEATRAAAAESAKAEAAAKAEAKAQEQLEKQVERTAEAVRRLAVSKGKTLEQADDLADFAANRVRRGETTAAQSVLDTRAGLRDEAKGTKESAREEAESVAKAVAEVNAQNEAAEKLWAASGEAAKTATPKIGGAGRALRSVAEAFLPDRLVSHVVQGWQAVGGVLSALGPMGYAAAVGVAAVAGTGIAAWVAFRMQVEAGYKRLESVVDGIKDRIADSTRSGERFREAGIKIGEGAREWDKVAAGVDKVTAAIREGNAEQERQLQLHVKNIELQKRAAEQRVKLEYGRKIDAAGTDEERAHLEGERDSKLAAINAKGGRLVAERNLTFAQAERDRVSDPSLLEAERARAQAAVGKYNTEASHRDELFQKAKRTVDSRLGTSGYDAQSVLADTEKKASEVEAQLKEAREKKDDAKRDELESQSVALALQVRDMRELVKLNEDLAKSAERMNAAREKLEAFEKENEQQRKVAEDRVAVARGELDLAKGDETLSSEESARKQEGIRRKAAEAEKRREREREKASAKHAPADAKAAMQADASALADAGDRGFAGLKPKGLTGKAGAVFENLKSRAVAAAKAMRDGGATADETKEYAELVERMISMLEESGRGQLGPGNRVATQQLRDFDKRIRDMESQLRNARN